MAATAREAGVSIVCGDTKVVEKHAADRLFINTAGVGAVPIRSMFPSAMPDRETASFSAALWATTAWLS
jgi:hydrogenase maturation factor